MEGMKDKKISVFYDDTTRVSRRDGILTDFTETEIILDEIIMIPRARIIRIEVINKSGNKEH